MPSNYHSRTHLTHTICRAPTTSNTSNFTLRVSFRDNARGGTEASRDDDTEYPAMKLDPTFKRIPQLKRYIHVTMLPWSEAGKPRKELTTEQTQ